MNITTRAEQELLSLDWENLSIEELMSILDRLGLGFYETLKLLLLKLKPGQKRYLMQMVQTLEIGKIHRRKVTKEKLLSVKQNPNIPLLIKNILTLLFWRSDRKNGYNHGDFSTLPQLNFRPTFAN